MQFDNGVRYLDYFSTDYKRNAYIMREGETSVPKSLQHASGRAIEARKIIRKQIKAGITAGETLNTINAALKKVLADTDKSGFFADLHSQGNHGGTLVTVGPSISAFRSDRDHLPIQKNHLFSLEYVVSTNLPERPGYPIVINIEGNHVVSSRGVEFLHPPNEKILLIH